MRHGMSLWNGILLAPTPARLIARRLSRPSLQYGLRTTLASQPVLDRISACMAWELDVAAMMPANVPRIWLEWRRVGSVQ